MPLTSSRGGDGTVVAVDGPPNDPEDWSDDQWQVYLQATAADAEIDGSTASGGASGFRRLRGSGAGSVIGAAMQGLEQALYGERPKEEIVAEADSDDPDRERSTFDPDDPASAVISLAAHRHQSDSPPESVESTRPSD